MKSNAKSYGRPPNEMFGNDPWSYGLERNRAEFEQFLACAHEQGLT